MRRCVGEGWGARACAEAVFGVLLCVCVVFPFFSAEDSGSKPPKAKAGQPTIAAPPLLLLLPRHCLMISFANQRDKTFPDRGQSLIAFRYKPTKRVFFTSKREISDYRDASHISISI